MTDLTTTANVVPISQPTGSNAIAFVIERALRDPSIDLAKLTQVIELRERIERREAEVAYDNAMADAQGKIEAVVKDAANEQTRSKYATYPQLDRAVRPAYKDAGFSLRFDTEPSDKPETLMVVCEVTHRLGHKRLHRIPMPTDGKGAKGGDVMSKTHATGSAVSYGMRYLLRMIFNIPVRDATDDDGNTVDPETKISEEQVKTILALMTKHDFDVNRLLDFFEKRLKLTLEAVADIPASAYNSVMAQIQKNIDEKAKRSKKR